MDFSKYLGEVGLTELWNLMVAHMDERLFIGTRAEYEAAIDSIPVGAMVVITDESDVVLPEVENSPSTSILGTALLGSMVLGKP
jgi:hypothetical protein